MIVLSRIAKPIESGKVPDTLCVYILFIFMTIVRADYLLPAKTLWSLSKVTREWYCI